MCGFLTYVKSPHANFPDFDLSKKILNRRGPDSQTELIDDDFYCYHTRLSIIDLDSRSNQPFFSDCRRYLIVFNGEIYNYKELTQALLEKNISLNTNSDTEVILKLYIEYNERMLPMLRGMFSFFIWDVLEKRAFIARDPYGIKPLYYNVNDDCIMFSSQLKSIYFASNLKSEISSTAINNFFLLGSIVEDNTIFDSISCFKSGYFMKIQRNKIIQYEQWSNVNDYIFGSSLTFPKLNDRSKVEKTIHDSLLNSTRYHSVSDVKLGIFLSSGIDSSSLASLLKESGISTFQGITVVFGEVNDETIGAQLIAKQLNIPLYIKRVTKTEFLEDLKEIFVAMDQPSIDGINTWYASKAAAECNIKVVLSGVGADELFQGYHYYRFLPFLMKLSSILLKYKLIYFMSFYIFKIISKVTQNPKWNYFTRWMKDFNTAWLLRRSFLVPSEFSNESDEQLNKLILKLFPSKNAKEIVDSSLVLTKYDTLFYLRNQLLRDSDWASMYHGVELRTPYVDHFLLKEMSPYFSLFKLFKNKKIIYNNLKFKLPKLIINRRKTGFEFPANLWLRESFSINSKYEYAKYILSKYKESLNVSSN